MLRLLNLFKLPRFKNTEKIDVKQLQRTFQVYEDCEVFYKKLLRRQIKSIKVCKLIRTKTPEEGQLVLDAFCNFLAYNNKFDQLDRDLLYKKLIEVEAYDSCVQYLKICRYIKSYPKQQITDNLVKKLDEKEDKKTLNQILNILATNPFLLHSEESLKIMEKYFQNDETEINQQDNQNEQNDEAQQEDQKEAQKELTEEQKTQQKLKNLRYNFEYLNNQIVLQNFVFKNFLRID